RDRSFVCSSRRRHTRCYRDWSSDVCSSDLSGLIAGGSLAGILYAVPAPTSDSSFRPVRFSTYARTRPPANIGAVVAMGRYDPTRSEERRVGKGCEFRWGLGV